MSALPPRPQWPDAEDYKRVQLVEARHTILDDDHEDLTREWMLDQVGEQKSAVMGRPDISVNPLASICHQLTTPGLYGVQPPISHDDATGAAVLIGPQGQLARAGWLTKMQRVQYLAVGLGDYLLRLDIPRDLGELTIRLVSPHSVYTRGHPDRPDEAVELWELRCRWHAAEEQHVWTWDKYDLGKTVVHEEDGTRERVREPSWRCVRVGEDGRDSDVSGVFIGRTHGYYGATGPGAYPYIADDGTPFLPWVTYRAVDSGSPWNQREKRAAARGSLNAATYATYTGYAARSASGKTAIVAGLVPVGVQVAQAPSDTKITNRPRYLDLVPGSIVYHEVETGGQAFVQEIGPGAELDTLDTFTANYCMRIAVQAGLNPSDVTRASANPSSGAALAISNKGRREYSIQVEPVFRRADERTLYVAAQLVRIAGLGAPPSTGYVIRYQPIPESPEEEAGKRAEIDWEVGHGFISDVDAYIRRTPGTSPEAASKAILRARLDKLRLEAEVKAAAEAAGLVQPTKAEAALVGSQTNVGALVKDVAAGLMPRESAKWQLVDMYGLTEQAAERILPRPEDIRPPALPAPAFPFSSAPGPTPEAESADPSDTEEESPDASV